MDLPTPGQIETIMRRAADLAMAHSAMRDTLIVDEKSRGQFVTNADIEVEDLLRGEITAAFKGARILGEEKGGALDETATGWAIDPIDGTTNYVLGLPIWGISAGYLQNGRSVLGAIALPELGLLLSAEAKGGLRVNGQPVAQRRPLRAPNLIALGENDFEAGSDTDSRAQLFRAKGFAVVRYRCAVFSLASAALGRLSGYIEHGCGLWDVAAAEIICREAGMTVAIRQVAPGRYSVDARWPDLI